MPKNNDRQILQKAINIKFIGWSSDWIFDSYNNDSAEILYIDRSNSNKWIVIGTFWVTRLGQRLKQNFTAIIYIYGNGNWKISKLCYDDPSVGDKDCKYY